MVNQGILGGLRLALLRGESLKQAMISFYNAGYEKQEIELAAKVLQQELSHQPQPTKVLTKPKVHVPQKPQQLKPNRQTQKQTPVKTIQKVSNYGQNQNIPKPVQKISNYEQGENKPKGKLMILLLVLLLLLLLGILTGVFLFKDELLEFFNNLF